MFIINLTYKADLEKIDVFLKEHIEFLDKNYALGHFLASGRKQPRTGGIILSNIESKQALVQILEQDPFKKNDLADYEVIEFIPTKTAPEWQCLLENQ